MTILKIRAQIIPVALASLFFIALTGSAIGQTVFVPLGATWKYLDDGSEQGSAWTELAFDDSSWASGPAELGYGEGETTTVGFGGDGTRKFITTYFRHTFSVADPTMLPGMKIELLRDDGAVVYFNGLEIGRSNMPAGPVTKDTRALQALGGGVETILVDFIVSPVLLNPGDNVIAVEIHQDTPGSSDMSFDVRATDAVGPTPPMIRNCLLTLSDSDTIIPITAQNLSATDFTSDDATLTFQVSGLESGQFELVSAPGIAITEFDQEEITDGDIQFVYAPGRFGAGEIAGNLADHSRLSEISGLVASIQNADILWAHEDSDNPATLIALGMDGSNRGEWTLTGASNSDWEDIGAATVDDQALLYIGDFGDNGASRTNLKILRVREPLLANDNGGSIPASDIETIDFQYPETPAGESGVGGVGVPARRDAESLIVDPHSGDIYILSKRETIGRLFRLAHQATYTGIQTLEYLGEMPAIIHDRVQGFSASSTAADISRDGLEILVRNYGNIMIFRRDDLETSIAELLTGDVIEQLPFVGTRYPEGEPVGEAICFTTSADAFFTVGETSGGAAVIPLFRYRRLPPNSPPAFNITVSDGALEDGPHPATVLFNAQPLEIWRHQNFTNEELADAELEATLWGDLADGDGDGRVNLIDYALGTDPRSPLDLGAGITIGRVEDSLTLTYQKHPDRTDITYQVQSSMDLQNWTDQPDELVETEKGIETRRATVDSPAGANLYLRLKISRVN